MVSIRRNTTEANVQTVTQCQNQWIASIKHSVDLSSVQI